MAYDKNDLEKKALAAIKKNKLVFIQDVIAYLPCNSATFYNHEMEKLESIKDALEDVKVKMKTAMRKKWHASDNATLQISLMKLIGGDEERKRLSQSYTDITTGGNEIKQTHIFDVDILNLPGEDEEETDENEVENEKNTKI